MCRYMVVSRCFWLYDWKKQVINNIANFVQSDQSVKPDSKHVAAFASTCFVCVLLCVQDAAFAAIGSTQTTMTITRSRFKNLFFIGKFNLLL